MNEFIITVITDTIKDGEGERFMNISVMADKYIYKEGLFLFYTEDEVNGRETVACCPQVGCVVKKVD